jgi:epoxyqueuosine reductase QueG
MPTQTTTQPGSEDEALARAAERIKALARSAGAPMAGVASVEAINEYAPPGTQPTDILPEARAVVMVGVESSPGGAWRTPDPRFMGIVSNNRLSKAKDIAYQIAEFIESEFGYYAMPYGTYALAAGGWDPVLSFKLCAELAGIGSRSLAGGMILNANHGFPYLGLCLTSMPLPADGPTQEDVCPHPSCVKMWEQYGTTPCINICPMCLSGSIDEEGKIEYWAYDRFRCAPRANYTRPRLLNMLAEVMTETDPERRKILIHGPDFSHHVSAIANSTEISGQCFECIRVCPVDRNRRLKQRS